MDPCKQESSPPPDPADLLIQRHFVLMMTEHMVDCAKAFDGDLTEMLVLAVIGQAHLKTAVLGMESGGPGTRAGLSAARISDAAGLPRETVRRKLWKMARKGWIHQGDDRRWRLTFIDGSSSASVALDGLFERGCRRGKSFVRTLKPHV